MPTFTINRMLETPHVVVGAAIATNIPNPYIAIPLSFLSHFVLDRTLHWNPHTYSETKKFGRPKNKSIVITAVDILLALIVGFLLASRVLPDSMHFLTIVLSCFAAVLPDVSKYPFFLFKKTRCGLYKKWVDLERSWQVETDHFSGKLTQIVVIIASLYWIFS